MLTICSNAMVGNNVGAMKGVLANQHLSTILYRGDEAVRELTLFLVLALALNTLPNEV